MKQLVANGQLEFINGGFVQHDEAAAHYVAMIDQTTRGHRSVKVSSDKSTSLNFMIGTDLMTTDCPGLGLMNCLIGGPCSLQLLSFYDEIIAAFRA